MASSAPRRPDDTRIAVIETDERAADRIADRFADAFAADDVAASLVDAGRGVWRVTLYFRSAVDRQAVRDLAAIAGGTKRPLHFGRVGAKDWVRDSLAGLGPVTVGRFVVHGAHDRARVPANRIGIEIEAALAFGTGHHGTTRGCLLALERICKAQHAKRLAKHRPLAVRMKRALKTHLGAGAHLTGPHILDLGTGSGVLAIAAARALRRKVLATDIDLSAVRAARANARLNRAGAMIEVLHAAGVAHHNLRTQAPFDLVFANILLGPLQRFAAPLCRLVAPGGRVVLSGLLPSQANAAIAAYRGLALERRLECDGWTTLIFTRRGRHRDIARRRAAS